MTKAWLGALGLAGIAVTAATAFAIPALANPAPPTPGMQVDDERGRCTAGFAARGSDGGYYLLTSGHCDEHDGKTWTYGENVPLGKIIASESEGAARDAAIIRLDPGVGPPSGDVGGHRVRDVLPYSLIQVGMPFCKVGAITGETCGVVKSKQGNVVEASVFSLDGDSGSPGYVMNADGTVSAVGLLMSSPDGDDNTTYFMLIHPLLSKWGLQILA
jgi:hypothetical protein